MSYLGWVRSICRDHLANNDYPKVLEIGVNYGQTALPLIQNLAYFERFAYVGVDIWIRPEVVEQITQFAEINMISYDANNPELKANGRDVVLFQENSLKWLASQDAQVSKFDVIFLDGDHNYQTVLNELKLLQNIIKPTSIIVCDDFSGQYAETDMFYADKKGYESIEIATPSSFTEKQGVRPAVQDFCSDHKMWSGFFLEEHEPIILFRQDIYEITHMHPTGENVPKREKTDEEEADYIRLRDLSFPLRLLEKSPVSQNV